MHRACSWTNGSGATAEERAVPLAGCGPAKEIGAPRNRQWTNMIQRCVKHYDRSKLVHFGSRHLKAERRRCCHLSRSTRGVNRLAKPRQAFFPFQGCECHSSGHYAGSQCDALLGSSQDERLGPFELASPSRFAGKRFEEVAERE